MVEKMEVAEMMTWFKDETHKTRFNAMWRKAARPSDDLEWRSALYVLASIEKEGLSDCIQDGYIDFDALYQLSDGWSTSEKALVMLAYDLYNGKGGITVHQLFRDLDEDNARVALEGLRLRYFG